MQGPVLSTGSSLSAPFVSLPATRNVNDANTAFLWSRECARSREMAQQPIPYPALVPVARGAVVVRDGECVRIDLAEARRLFRAGDVLVAHAVFVSGRLRTPPARAVFDVLELFAYARPAQPCIPSPIGLARALGLSIPQTPEE